jgi:hypothetical protein
VVLTRGEAAKLRMAMRLNDTTRSACMDGYPSEVVAG